MVALPNFFSANRRSPCLAFNKHFYTFLTAKQGVTTDDIVVVDDVDDGKFSVCMIYNF